ncbi:MAG: hypothetical protein OXG46_11450 [Chloroflexi bacterium]|nr:hypothetical protein [Chloroflexota bacterium]MCY3937967.1 hypothetical protein [Chloroflexota bacterium]
MKKVCVAGAIVLIVSVVALGCSPNGSGISPAMEKRASDHMVAEALLTAHFIAAAQKAGMSDAEINAVLNQVADVTIISEFWISDDQGKVVFTNIPGTGFAFPTSTDAEGQAAPFAALLTGERDVVVQEVTPRVLDDVDFKYVGVSGVDQKRIVQVGISGATLKDSSR